MAREAPQSRETLRPREFALALVALVAILLMTYSGAFTIPYAHHDQYRYFHDPAGDGLVKNSCAGDPEYLLIYQIGRPLAAELECVVFKNTRTLEDLARFRVGVIVVLSVSAALLASLLVTIRFPIWSAIFVSAAVFSLPGASNTVFMTNFPNAIAPGAALAAFLLFNPANGAATVRSPIYLGRFLAAIIALQVSLLLYPALAFCFFIAIFCLFAFHNSTRRRGRWLGLLANTLFFGMNAAAYYGMIKLFVAPTGNPSYRFEIGLGNILARLQAVFSDILPMSANLHNIYTSNIMLVCVVAIIILSAVTAAIRRRRARADRLLGGGNEFETLGVLLLLFIAVNGVFITSAVAFVLFRFIFASSALMFLALLWALFLAGDLLLARRPVTTRRAYLIGVSVILSFAGLIFSNITMTENALNSNMEIQFIRNRIAPHLASGIKRVHVIFPRDPTRSFNGLPALTDEFNRPSIVFNKRFPYFTLPEMVRVALLGAVEEGGFRIVPCDAVQTCVTATAAIPTKARIGAAGKDHQLALWNERGEYTSATLDGSVLRTLGWGVVGKLQIAGAQQRIVWSNGTLWARDLPLDRRILGDWYLGSSPKSSIVLTSSLPGEAIQDSPEMALVDMTDALAANGIPVKHRSLEGGK